MEDHKPKIQEKQIFGKKSSSNDSRKYSKINYGLKKSRKSANEINYKINTIKSNKNDNLVSKILEQKIAKPPNVTLIDMNFEENQKEIVNIPEKFPVTSMLKKIEEKPTQKCLNTYQLVFKDEKIEKKREPSLDKSKKVPFAFYSFNRFQKNKKNK